MKVFALCLAASLGLLSVSCLKREKVDADGTRRLTMRDTNLKWNATDDERFANAAGSAAPMLEGADVDSPVVAKVVPETWKEAPTSSFRLIHYQFGEGGEIYVSVSRGGVLENVNRWLSQFEKEPLKDLAAEEAVEIAGYRGVWVKADGRFGGAMGAEARDDWALRGVVAEKEGEILTVKLMGPVKDIGQAEADLRSFVAGLEAAAK